MRVLSRLKAAYPDKFAAFFSAPPRRAVWIKAEHYDQVRQMVDEATRTPMSSPRTSSPSAAQARRRQRWLRARPPAHSHR